MTTSFGLDFGTTNSVLAISQDGVLEIVDIESASDSKKMMKSVIFFDEEEGNNVGQEAIDQYVSFGGTYGRFMQSIKAFLPNKSFTETYVFGKRYEIEDLIALILKAIKRRGELHVGHVVDSVVMGRPVLFSDDKELDLLAEERLRTAALRSGFTNVRFVYEPIAATLSYETQLHEGQEKLVLMGDFGGGTSDFVIMKLKGGKHDSKEDRRSDILSTGGVYIAGDSFDASIMWHKLAKHFTKGAKTYGASNIQILDSPHWIPHTLCQWHMIPQLRDRKTLQIIRSLRGVTDEDRKAIDNLHTLIIENLGYMLFREIERAKCELSVVESTTIEFKSKGISICESITRSEFETLASDKFIKISSCVDETLASAGVDARDIDVVLLTGGTSLIPKLRQNFANKFGNEKLLQVDTFTSVAFGLGLSTMQ